MQGKKEMIEDILQTAKKSAAAMVSEATDAQNEQIEAVRASLAADKKRTDDEIAQAAEVLYAGKVKLSELEAAKIALAARSACVSAVYDEIYHKLISLPDKEYLALMKKLVARSCADGDEIVAGKTDKRITAEWVKSVASSCGKKLTLSSQKGDFSCGVLIRNDRFDIDLTAKVLVEELRDRTVADTAEKLGLK